MISNKAVFGSRKTISGKENVFMCLAVKNSFYGKLILVFGSFKHFTRKCIKSGKRNQNPAKEMQPVL